MLTANIPSLNEIIETGGDLVSELLEYEFRGARNMLTEAFEIALRPFARIGKVTDDVIAIASLTTRKARTYALETAKDAVATAIAIALSSQRYRDDEEIAMRMYTPMRFPEEKFGPLEDPFETP